MAGLSGAVNRHDLDGRRFVWLACGLAEPQNKLPGLQIARAAAALGIAYFHSWHVTMPFPPGTSYPIPFLKEYGWIAVNFFFSISGFVICLVATKPNFRPLQFLVRRVFRLYPLWIVTSLLFLGLSVIALGMPTRSSPAFFAYCLTLLPTEGFPFYDVGWSLQHELAFYALAALLVPNVGLFGLSVFLCAGAIADQVLTLPWFLHQYASYYPNFLAGIVAFAANGYTKRFGVWLPIAVGIGLLALFTQTIGQLAFPFALFFLLVGFINIEFDERLLAERLGVLLGDASYSIYLLHPLVFYTVYWRLQPPLPPVWSQEILRFGSIAVVCLLSIASWKLFESPTIRFGNALIGRFKRSGIEASPRAVE
ncbi:acyltransferase [Bradyrhizobium sp. Ash2021]|uniref:acyltransferase family protein n=1 Tax=Bradyrhizobium sp. Ash2021 TaxID=2954771 RepID=UPI002815180E|nr:acyltransferase [Bradyrhizobium sp. Ash2021]WMT73254.1 acyltransferase [Bradyrhizobium sp. Ash2021]